MIWFSFLSAAICYRENLHIGVAVIPMMLRGPARIAVGWLIEICMMGTNLFMLCYGIKLVQTTWHQSISDFPFVSVGAVLSAGAARRRHHRPLRHRAALAQATSSPSRRTTASARVCTE